MSETSHSAGRRATSGRRSGDGSQIGVAWACFESPGRIVSAPLERKSGAEKRGRRKLRLAGDLGRAVPHASGRQQGRKRIGERNPISDRGFGKIVSVTLAHPPLPVFPRTRPGAQRRTCYPDFVDRASFSPFPPLAPADRSSVRAYLSPEHGPGWRRRPPTVSATARAPAREVSPGLPGPGTPSLQPLGGPDNPPVGGAELPRVRRRVGPAGCCPGARLVQLPAR
jgi:hypothetical protein